MVGRRRLFLLLAGLALAAVLFAIPVVRVSEVEVGERVLVAGAGARFTVTLEYLHSVELGRVAETYEVTGCEIRLTRLAWPGHGAGLPSSPGDLEAPTATGDGGYILENLSLRLGGALSLSTRYMISPRLVVSGSEIATGGLVEIRACTGRSVAWLLWQWLRGSLDVIAGS